MGEKYSELSTKLTQDVIELTRNDSRRVGTYGHEQARDFIVGRLIELGAEPYKDKSFTLAYGSEFANVIAKIRGQNDELDPILLGAHYDTCGDIQGAGDNAAAVAILLTVLENLRSTAQERTVIFAFFDAEEPPYFLGRNMGSIRFYEDQLLSPVHAAIILDLVGHNVPMPGLEDALFITGAESDPKLAEIIESSQPVKGLRTVPTLNSYVGDLSDHHIFRINERPYLLLTCGHWSDYHMPSDTAEKLNYAKMEQVCNYLENLTQRVGGTKLMGPFDSANTLETELRLLRRNVLPALSSMGVEIRLENRSDIDSLVYGLMSRFGL